MSADTPRETKAGSAEPAFAVPEDLELADDTEVWIVRHGETEWSKSGQHTGVTDIPLTEVGRREAEALRDLLADLHPAAVLSSPRRRALDTAELAGLTVSETVEDLGEWHYGDYEGLTTPQIREAVPGWTVWADGCPGGDSANEAGARADRVLRRIVPLLGDGPIVLVGHGHFSRVLGARWIRQPAADGAHLQMSTAAASVLGAEHGTPTLRHWNLPNPAHENSRTP